MAKQSTQNVFHNGKMLALWGAHLSKTSGRTGKLFDTIDPEIPFSIAWTLKSFDQEVGAAMADKMLSPFGQKQAQGNAANKAIKRLAERAKDMMKVEESLREAHSNAVEIPVPSVNDTMIDIELAKMLRENTPTPTQLRHSSERMRHAVLRMPVELTGITQDVQDSIRQTFLAPSMEADFSQTLEAIGHVRYALRKAMGELAPSVPNSGADVADYLDSLAKAGVRIPAQASPMGSDDPKVRTAEISRRLGLSDGSANGDLAAQIDAEVDAWAAAQPEGLLTVGDLDNKRAELERKYAAQPA